MLDDALDLDRAAAPMNKPARSFPGRLSELLGATLNDALKTQGFASAEIVTRWAEIVGARSPPIASR